MTQSIYTNTVVTINTWQKEEVFEYLHSLVKNNREWGLNNQPDRFSKNNPYKVQKIIHSKKRFIPNPRVSYHSIQEVIDRTSDSKDQNREEALWNGTHTEHSTHLLNPWRNEDLLTVWGCWSVIRGFWDVIGRYWSVAWRVVWRVGIPAQRDSYSLANKTMSRANLIGRVCRATRSITGRHLKRRTRWSVVSTTAK